MNVVKNVFAPLYDNKSFTNTNNVVRCSPDQNLCHMGPTCAMVSFNKSVACKNSKCFYFGSTG